MIPKGIRHLVFHDILWVSWCQPVLGFTETLVKQCREREYHDLEVRRGLKNGWRWAEEAHTEAEWEQPFAISRVGSRQEVGEQERRGITKVIRQERKGSGKKKGGLRCTTRHTTPLIPGWTLQYMHVHFYERRLGSLWWLTALYRRPCPTM